MANKNKKSATRTSAARAGVVTGGTALAMLLTSPVASALQRDDGDDPAAPLSVFEILGLFVGIPVLLFAVIAALVYRGGRSRAGADH